MCYQLYKFLNLALKNIYYYIFLLLFSIFKINNKKIIIHNFCGKGYGDSGKYICNELVNYDYEIYRATTEKYKNSLPEKIHYVRFDSLKYLYHLATAKIWINNETFSLGIRKRKEQFYIQTWHGCIGVKKIGAALGKKLGYFSILATKNDSKMSNLFISNSTFCTNNYKNNLWYNGEILEYGCPRNDIILNNNKVSIESVKKYFGLLNSEKVCLYAPSFRNSCSFEGYLSIYNIKYKSLINNLKNKFGGNWKLLIRFHPSISNMSNELFFSDKDILNATDYPDIQELLVTADFMITDYSSCIFDYAISKKPAMLYAPDIVEYNKNERDFLIKLQDTPFPIATNNIELETMILNFDIDRYVKKVNKFYDNIGLKETGKSCKKIVDLIKNIVN